MGGRARCFCAVPGTLPSQGHSCQLPYYGGSLGPQSPSQNPLGVPPGPYLQLKDAALRSSGETISSLQSSVRQLTEQVATLRVGAAHLPANIPHTFLELAMFYKC